MTAMLQMAALDVSWKTPATAGVGREDAGAIVTGDRLSEQVRGA
jgi:hypothetical protein